MTTPLRLSSKPAAAARGLVAFAVVVLLAACGPRDTVDLTDDAIASLAARIDPEAAATTLAARALADGHWALANRAGETFTASGAQELKRGFATLAPQAGAKDPKLTILISAASLFGPSARLDALPSDIELRLIAHAQSLAVTRRPGGVPHLQLTPAIAMEATSARDVAAVQWHLARALRRLDLRVIALEPGGPTTLGRTPRTDPVTGKALIDAIEPMAIADALPSLRGEAAVIVGRLDPRGRELTARTTSGRSASIPVDMLKTAAAQADVGLIVLHGSSAVQPGGRNWLWRTIDIPGLPKSVGETRLGETSVGETGAGEARLSDALTAMFAGKRVLIKAKATDDRLEMTIAPLDPGRLTDPMTWWRGLEAMTGEMLGRVAVDGAILTLPSPVRQRELDRRLFKRLPSGIPIGYGALLLLGLVGAPTAWRWWERIWPQEQRTEYAGGFGYRAAQGVRAGVFAIAFLPLAAILAAPAQLWRLIRRGAAAKT